MALPKWRPKRSGYCAISRTVVRLLARGATPGRAIVGGQGLEAVTHTVGRGGHFRHVLTNFGTFEPGTSERATEDWVKSNGGDPVALVRVLDTFVDTPMEELARITVPTLVLTSTAAALAGALPGGRYVLLPGNHFTAAIAPEFEAAVTSFLAEDRVGNPPT